ncbi:hypothetical protein [Aquipuribacter hungaricus]|uniref:hypothetical protein n=1 Tax=Aquipuribacter hungaricus TaxID=545624 RepID=UPI0030EDC627
MSAADPRPTVVVSVGTDHHRFDRLSDWLEPWIARHPEVRVVHQHGSSRPARGAEPVRMLPREEMLALQQEATAVVVQGGPGSMLDARLCGRLPVVVPRLARLHEVVDDHQVHFCDRLSALGWITLADDADRLAALLDEALADPQAFRCTPHVSAAPETALVLARRLEAVRAAPVGFVSWRRLLAVVRAPKVTVAPTPAPVPVPTGGVPAGPVLPVGPVMVPVAPVPPVVPLLPVAHMVPVSTVPPVPAGVVVAASGAADAIDDEPWSSEPRIGVPRAGDDPVDPRTAAPALPVPARTDDPRVTERTGQA